MGASNFEILACEETPLGMICLRQRELLGPPGTMVTELTLDHAFLMSSHVTASEQAVARYAIEMHSGRALNVLVGGLGLGYTAREVLLAGGDRVARVEVVEYLPPVIKWMEQDLLPLSGALKADERVAIVEGDVYARLEGPVTQKYDLIIIDVDHSPDEHLGTANESFYTEAGLRRAREHLTDGGVLAVWSYAEHSPFATALQQVFGAVRVEPITIMNDVVDAEQTDWLFFVQL
jgi:spermidine synthase